MFLHFNIRNFEIPEYRSFYIWSFRILIPTQTPGRCQNLKRRNVGPTFRNFKIANIKITKDELFHGFIFEFIFFSFFIN